MFAFILVELALQSVEAAMKDVGEGPEHLLQILFELCVGKKHVARLDHGADGDLSLVLLRKRAMIDFVCGCFCAVEGEIV